MKNVKCNIKEHKAISIVSLIILVTILMIITSIVTMNIQTRYQAQSVNKLSSDLKLLKDKVLLYYIENGQYPIQGEIEDGITEYGLDLSKLSGLTLNYGSGTEDEDKYIINISNGTIYYKKGIKYNGNYINSVISDNEIDSINVIQINTIVNET